jgi:hypothetical protein
MKNYTSNQLKTIAQIKQNNADSIYLRVLLIQLVGSSRSYARLVEIGKEQSITPTKARQLINMLAEQEAIELTHAKGTSSWTYYISASLTMFGKVIIEELRLCE